MSNDPETPGGPERTSWKGRLARVGAPVRAPGGSPGRPGWLALTPSLSIAVFVIVAVLTTDADASSRIGLALIAAVVLGPLVSYLCARFWPGARDAESAAMEGGDQPPPGGETP